ncbi:MAG: aldo/keto reductase [Bryobacteraceae bacterium]
METRTLSDTNLRVSRVCLGTMAFGSETNESMAARIVDRCLDRGVNFFDTANVYNFGQAELILGNLIKGRRDRVIVASKVGMKMGDGPNESGLSRAAVLNSIDESLRRLGTDYLDLYYLHMPDHAAPIEETLDTMDQLVRAGKIRYPAVSNYSAWQLCRILWLCDTHGYRPTKISQTVYNLLARGIEDEYVPFSKELGLALVVYNPLARGLLAAKKERGPVFVDVRARDYQSSLDRYQHPAYFEAADELHGIADRAGRSLVDLSLNWLLHHTTIDSAVIGATNVEQLEQNLNSLDHGPLAPETVADCDAVWRKLRGVMPRYYR